MPEPIPVPVGVVVNGQDRGCNGLLLVIGRRLLLRQADLPACGVPMPAEGPGHAVATSLAGEDYVALDDVPGVSARLDASGTLLLLDVSAERYAPVRLGPPDAAVAVSRSIPAAYIDYDLTFTQDRRTTAFSALLDAGVSGGWGVLAATGLVGTGRTPNVRLDTAYTLDFPGRRIRLVVGDTLGHGSAWSQPVRFGGIRIGTDFSLDPSRLTYPLPVLQGGSALPSTVELAAREGVRDFAVEPGLFSYAYRPQFSGAGDVTMIVRDIAGNQRVVTRSFYASTSQLRAVLADFSLEGGLLRRDYGIRSFDYGAAFGAASLRYGLTSTLTLESRLESGGGVSVGGFGGQLVVQPLGEIRLAGALSSSEGRTGTLLQVQAQRLTRAYGLTASYRAMSADYRQVGDPWTTLGARRELAFSGSLAMGRAGSVNLGYLSTRTGASRSTLASASYSIMLGDAFVSLGAQRQSGDDGRSDWLFGMVTLPLGRTRHLSFSADSQQVSALYEKAVPTDAGLGYRVGLGRENHGAGWAEGMATLRTAVGDLELAGLYREQALFTRVEARGALVAAGGELAATQRVGDAFAVVDVTGDPGAAVMLENRPVPMPAVKAGAGGHVLVTGLAPYVANRVGIDPTRIPIEVPLGDVEQVVTPGWGKAVKVTFGKHGTHPARLRVVDLAGAPLEAGREVVIEVQGRPRPTAATASPATVTLTGHDGEIYLEDFPPHAVLRIADGQGGHCIVRLGDAAPADVLAHPIEAACQPEPRIAGS
ncbi:fimbria/pilus outer membrane usher protein [Novosphingobium sp. BL-8H]|uniref:fimbria/pilus outer membrane usher protein n=1 Tax=Novosphingobium sp. BL-8H TaxID=3127640 RepID=UPI003757DE6B